MNRFVARNALAAAVLAACPVIAGDALAADAPANYAALGKDVQILARVLETATAPDDGRRRWDHGGARIEGLYLAGQGMVFRVRLNGMNFTHAFFEAPVPPVPPIPPVPVVGMGNGESIVIDHDAMIDSDEMDSIIEDAMSEAQDAMEEMGMEGGMGKQVRDELRALREAQRNAARAYREKQRALAEASRGDKTPTQADRAAAEKARADFDAANQKLRTRVVALRAEQRQKFMAKLQQTESTLLDALCSYAGSTRRLQASEHVSLVIDSEDDDENSRHRIWVIRKGDLEACASGNQSAEFLRQKAVNYTL